MIRFANSADMRRLAVKLPSEDEDGKPSYDEDFKAGFLAGKAAWAKNGYQPGDVATKAYRQVSMKYGSWWTQGFKAALQVATGAVNESLALIAKKMHLF
jgi:hypothetical protein